MTRDNKEHGHFHEFGKGNEYSDFGDNFLVKSLRVPERTLWGWIDENMNAVCVVLLNAILRISNKP